jgi:hypothetical protein
MSMNMTRFLRSRRWLVLASLTASAFAVAGAPEPTTVMSESFQKGLRQADGAAADWYFTAGSFSTEHKSADNRNSSHNQYLTTAVPATELSAKQSIRISFRFAAGLKTSAAAPKLMVGLFTGKAATTDGWNQYQPDGTGRDWSGYAVALATDASPALAWRTAAGTDGTANKHPFFDRLTLGEAEPSKEVYTPGTWRTARVELKLDAEGRAVVTLWDGPDEAGLAEVLRVTETDPANAPRRFDNLAFYFVTADDKNGRIAIDDVKVQTLSVE